MEIIAIYTVRYTASFNPIASFIGGLSMGLSPKVILVNLVPVIIMAIILIIGLELKP
ncbi:MAG: ethanolamine utilization protein EutH, partial [Clostridiaceae bacterium]|nr:ethanolamine utilization protein EutH [Clostridiaceae bacterium]